MNSILNLMKSRRGIRQFSTKPIPKEMLHKILEAAISAPSGPGISGTHILVIDDPFKKQALRHICEDGEKHWFESQPKSLQERLSAMSDFSFTLDYLEQAPHLIIVTTRPRDPEIPYAIESAFLAVGFMLVMIEGEELGTMTYTPSLVRDEDFNRLNALLGLPEGETVQAILPVGFPEKKPGPKPIKEFKNVYLNKFSNPFV